MHGWENKSQECQMIWNLDTSDNRSTCSTLKYSTYLLDTDSENGKLTGKTKIAVKRTKYDSPTPEQNTILLVTVARVPATPRMD